MKKPLFYGLMFVSFVLSGCAIRAIPYDVDRVDQEITGNRGVVRGDVSSVPVTERKKTKKMYNIEIELPMSGADKLKKERDSSGGNKGYVQTETVPERKKRVGKKRGSAIKLRSLGTSTKPQVVYQVPLKAGGKYKREKGVGVIVKKEEKIYIVKKGDTLQKIADKMYGTTKKWKKIYNANKDVLEAPDVIRPGQKLVIPE